MFALGLVDIKLLIEDIVAVDRYIVVDTDITTDTEERLTDHS